MLWNDETVTQINGKNPIDTINQVSNVRFFIIIFEGVHYFQYFSQEDKINVLYQFAANSSGLKTDEFKLFYNKNPLNEKNKKIVEEFTGTTTGRYSVIMRRN